MIYMNKQIQRGDIYYANLEPVVGSEQGGVRPVLVVQNNTGNKHSPTVIVAMITSSETKQVLPTHCVLSPCAVLADNSIVLMEQLRTIDKRRLQSYIGAVWHTDMSDIDTALAVSVGLQGEHNDDQ
jgi:mRNA interferase MazF